jgi:hypothetical protein
VFFLHSVHLFLREAGLKSDPSIQDIVTFETQSAMPVTFKNVCVSAAFEDP